MATYGLLIDTSNEHPELQVVVVDNEIPQKARAFVRLELSEEGRLIRTLWRMTGEYLPAFDSEWRDAAVGEGENRSREAGAEGMGEIGVLIPGDLTVPVDRGTDWPVVPFGTPRRQKSGH